MPSLDDAPEAIRPFLSLGLNLEWSDGKKEATADCPGCGNDKKKFSVRVEDGRFNCFVCKITGNGPSFMKWLWQASYEQTLEAQYDVLADDRGLLSPDTPREWGAAVSLLTGEWLLPGYDADGKLTNLYRWVKTKEGRKLYGVKGLKPALFGVQLFDKAKPNVHQAEGPWDGMAWWEEMRRDGHEQMLDNTNVTAAPGATVFMEQWGRLYAGKHLTLLYDNDHPKAPPKTGVMSEPAGLAGIKNAVAVLSKAEEQPASVSYLQWGEQGYDPEVPSGCDVRDVLRAGDGEVLGRHDAMVLLLSKVVPVPAEWVPGDTGSGEGGVAKDGSLELLLLPCDKWSKLVQACRLALRWNEGLDRALSIMLGTVLSTDQCEDQVWVKIIGMPSSGKSTLCEALSANKQYIFPKSTITGFHSGFDSSGDGSDDNSLINKLRGKTLVTKDGDTLLKAPNKLQILSEARDLYDKVSRVSYRNKINDRNYENLNVTWLLCGTESLREIDESDLGQRFLDCVIAKDVTREDERATALRVAHRVFSGAAVTANGTPESRETPETTKMKQLCGGYVRHLRENAAEILAGVGATDEALVLCVDMAEFMSFMRTRPAKGHNRAQKELCFRLTAQMTKLIRCLAAVLNKPSIDDPEVMRRMLQVCSDTSRGDNLDIVAALRAAGPVGMTIAELAGTVKSQDSETRSTVRFLMKLKVVETFMYRGGGEDLFGNHREKGKAVRHYRLTPHLSGLCDAVLGRVETLTKVEETA